MLKSQKLFSGEAQLHSSLWHQIKKLHTTIGLPLTKILINTAIRKDAVKAYVQDIYYRR